MKYVTVGFKITEENSIHYGKATDLETFHKDINTAIEKGADFISLRIVKQDLSTNTPNSQTSLTNVCAKCGKEVEQAVINYCTHPKQKDRFKGKVYCRECQEGY